MRPPPAVVDGGPNAVSFRRRDYLGDPARPPRRRRCATWSSERTGMPPDGPVAVLTQLRTWGWLFNPITIYYCFDRDGHSVAQTVVEVTNTPMARARSPTCSPGRGSTGRGQGAARVARSCPWT